MTLLRIHSCSAFARWSKNQRLHGICSDLQQLFSESITRQALGAHALQMDGANVLQAATKNKWAWINAERLKEHSDGTLARFCDDLGQLRTSDATGAA
jgi:hypothetical protein